MELDKQVKDFYSKVLTLKEVSQGLEYIKNDQEATVAEQRFICEIPAPPFKESKRAEYIMRRMTELGLQEVKMDSAGNVYGVRPGNGCGPKILIEAHLDTVFPEETDVKVKEADGRLYAPGIDDDARGLAVLLGVIRALNETGIATVGDIVFAGIVGEEGLGDLRGMKAFFNDNTDIAACIGIDGSNPAIKYLATGSRRYKITFSGRGGHSFNDFGLPSAIHALGRAINRIADLQVAAEPKTTFTVGIVNGGTSVNSIAGEASMLIDMRSSSEAELAKLEAQIMMLVNNAAAEENNRWNSNDIKVDIILVGNRPAGSQQETAVIIQAAWLATQAVGQRPELALPSSNNANWPISKGIPAITLYGGGKSGKNHSLEEWYDPTDAYISPQRVLLTALGLVGIAGMSDPLI